MTVFKDFQANLYVAGAGVGFSSQSMSAVGSQTNIFEIDNYDFSLWDPRQSITVSNAPSVKKEIPQTGRIIFDSDPAGTPSVKGTYLSTYEVGRAIDMDLEPTANLEDNSGFQDDGQKRDLTGVDISATFTKVEPHVPIDGAGGSEKTFKQSLNDADLFAIKAYQDFQGQDTSSPSNVANDREIIFYGYLSESSITSSTRSMVRGSFTVDLTILDCHDSYQIDKTQPFAGRVDPKFIQ